ncbi:hypothetical protein EMIT0P291_170018 [Pseudomonas sp. IT-P291]
MEVLTTQAIFNLVWRIAEQEARSHLREHQRGGMGMAG